LRIWEVKRSISAISAKSSERTKSVELTAPMCDYCGHGRVSKRRGPMVVAWKPGGELVGNFGFPIMWARESVMAVLTEKLSGFKAGDEVQHVYDPFAHWDETLPCVDVPYHGERLLELVIETLVQALPETSMTPQRHCKECGQPVSRKLTGVATHRFGRLQPRKPDEGLFVAYEAIKTASLFRVRNIAAGLFATDEFKHLCEACGFADVDFYDAGQIIGVPASAPPPPQPVETKRPPEPESLPPPPLDPVGFRVVRPPNAERIGYSGLVPIVVQHLDEDASLYFGRASLDASLAKATAGQRAVYAIYWLMEEIANGGLEQFFGNSTGMLWKDAVDGLRHVGAEPQAEALLAAGALFPDGAPPTRRGLRNEQLKPIEAQVGAMERGLYGAPVSIQQRVFDYILTHPDEFFLPDPAAQQPQN